MDRKLREAIESFWETRYNTLELKCEKSAKEYDRALAKLVSTFSEEQAELHRAAEALHIRYDADVHANYYKSGFADAVRLMFNI